eukprot:TRINITY_DN2443_c0_g3_i1.p1 TRINITY_DN2443_c0_g3~~TRINITY_DN2443_c0_g3_i1.p1  ORF type:complete len:878 (+),score=147.31 TRINITY_DN2443_c0_g3_i1:319-2952(+)
MPSSVFLNPQMEEEYQEWMFWRNRDLHTTLGSIMVGLVFLCAIPDYLYSPLDYKMLLTFRFGLFAPLMSILLFLMMKESIFHKHTYKILFSMAVVSFFSYLTSGVLSTQNSSFYYMLSLVSCYLIVGMFVTLPFPPQVFLSLLSIVCLYAVDKTGAVVYDTLFVRSLFWMNVIFLIRAFFCQAAYRELFLMHHVCHKDTTLLEKEKNITERLLLNILPASIVDRVKQKESIADRFQMCSVIFAEIKGLEDPNNNNTPEELFTILNQVFTLIDQRISLFGLEKIKTISNCYLAVSGVPIANDRHLESAVSFAFDMLETVRKYNNDYGRNLTIRIGLHCGQIICGVIGQLKTIYDVWGDTCNVASRMQYYSQPWKIHVSEIVHDLIKHKYWFEDRGILAIKGKGQMHTFFIGGILNEYDSVEGNLQEKEVAKKVVIPSQSEQAFSIVDTLRKGNPHFNRFSLKFFSDQVEGNFHYRYCAFIRQTMGISYVWNTIFQLLYIAVDIKNLPHVHDAIIVYIVMKVFCVVGLISLALICFIPSSVEWYVKNNQVPCMINYIISASYPLINGAFVSPIFYWYLFLSFLFDVVQRAYLRWHIPFSLVTFTLFQVLHNIQGTFKLSAFEYTIANWLWVIVLTVMIVAHYFMEITERLDFLVDILLREQKVEISKEKEQSEKLLKNILPEPVVDALKRSNKVDPERYSDVTVLWSDIVGFTDFCSNKTPAEVVNCLDTLFSEFDKFTVEYGLEKIKTVGDAFVVAGGLPLKSQDHAPKVVRFAFVMIETIKKFNAQSGLNLNIRIGIHTGSCVTGIIGIKKFTYELIGEAVRIANQLESSSQAGKILISQNVANLLEKDKFVLSEHQIINTADQGDLNTYFVVAKFV